MREGRPGTDGDVGTRRDVYDAGSFGSWGQLVAPERLRPDVRDGAVRLVVGRLACHLPVAGILAVYDQVRHDVVCAGTTGGRCEEAEAQGELHLVRRVTESLLWLRRTGRELALHGRQLCEDESRNQRPAGRPDRTRRFLISL